MPTTPIVKVWTFQSKSDPDKTYQTLLRQSGYKSCNCPGWTRRVASDGSRSCTHTRDVDQGLADSKCVAFHDYNASTQPPPKIQTPPPVATTKPVKSTPTPRRKVLWK